MSLDVSLIMKEKQYFSEKLCLLSSKFARLFTVKNATFIRVNQAKAIHEKGNEENVRSENLSLDILNKLQVSKSALDDQMVSLAFLHLNS